jgi:ABC-type sugar transport system ATPase subunit
MRNRLIVLRDGRMAESDFAERLISEEEIEDELLDEILNGEAQQEDKPPEEGQPPVSDLKKLNAEIEE